jgi:iron(III) transport system permease protein
MVTPSNETGPAESGPADLGPAATGQVATGQGRRPGGGSYPGWTALAVVLTLVVVLPYLPVVAGVFVGRGEAWDHIRDNVLLRYVVNTVLLVVLSVMVAAVVGTAGAWVLHRYRFFGRRVWQLLFAAPLALPVYISTFTWSDMVGYGGLLFRITGFSLPFRGIPAAVFILAFGLYPYVYLVVRGALLRGTGTLFEAVASLSWTGAAVRWPYYRNVIRGVLPTLRPAVVGGSALVGMEVMNAYATPIYLGVETLSTGVFRTWFSLGDLPSATRLAAFVLVIVIFLAVLERAGRGRRQYGLSRSSAADGASRTVGVMGTVRVTLVLAVPVLIGFVLPLVQLLLWTFGGSGGSGSVGSGVAPGVWREVAMTTVRTVGLAAAGTVLILVLALLLNFVAYLRPGRFLGVLRGMAGIGYAVPGTVIAIGVLAVFRTLRIVDERLFFFGTVGGLLFAYAGRYSAVAIQPLRAAFERHHRSTVDAARSLGSPPREVLSRVILPLFTPALTGAALMVAIDIIKDLPMTLLLRPFNFSTLAIDVYRLAMDERLPEAAPRALLLVLLGILTISLIMIRPGRKKG